MRIPIFILCATIALGGCSTFEASDAPVCDGRHRRPANLHGSALGAAPTPVVSEDVDASLATVAPTDVQTPVIPALASVPQGGCA